MYLLQDWYMCNINLNIGIMFYELTLIIKTFLQNYFHVRQEMKLSIEYLTIVKDMKWTVNSHNPEHK